MGGTVSKIAANKEKFIALDVKQQCIILYQMFFLFACKPQNAKLGAIDCGDNAGRIRIANDKLFNSDMLLLVNQSPAGLYEERIDLKTVLPKKDRKEWD